MYLIAPEFSSLGSPNDGTKKIYFTQQLRREYLYQLPYKEWNTKYGKTFFVKVLDLNMFYKYILIYIKSLPKAIVLVKNNQRYTW